MKILITGVHGFVGSNLVEALKGQHIVYATLLLLFKRYLSNMTSCVYLLVKGIDKRPVKTGSTGNNTNRDVLVFVISFNLSVRSFVPFNLAYTISENIYNRYFSFYVLYQLSYSPMLNGWGDRSRTYDTVVISQMIEVTVITASEICK